MGNEMGNTSGDAPNIRILIEPQHLTRDPSVMTDARAFRDCDLVVAAPPQQNVTELVRSLEDFARGGGTIVVPVWRGQDVAVLQSFVDLLGATTRITSAGWTSETGISCPEPRLRDYLEKFRPTANYLRGLPGKPLAIAEVGSAGGHPLASLLPYQNGQVFICHGEGDVGMVVHEMADLAWQMFQRPTVPDYGDDALAPGEGEVRSRIEGLERELEKERARAEELGSWRTIIGPAQGNALVTEVKRALGFVLEPVGWVVDHDHVDQGDEDFLLIAEDGRRIIGEAKGVNRGIARSHVAQADTHRLLANEAEDDESAEHLALLVVNQWVGSDDFEARRRDVAEAVRTDAAMKRVAVLRSWDLFELVRRRLDEVPFPSVEFEAGLESGGWLEVSETDCTPHRGSRPRH